MTNKETIMEAAIEVFNEKGIKFTMDDLAKHLSISKKTIYKYFDDKETLLLKTIEHCFKNIKASEATVLKNDALSTVDKIRQIIVVLPNHYYHIDWRKIYSAKDKYPKLYKEIESRIESDWENTFALLEQGIREGVIKPISLPILKIMIEASIEHFLNTTTLLDNDISYRDALDQLIEIIMDGICVNKQ